ncbi:MAG: hypothetical protein HKN98_01305, partial [Silicimonas sp.]|nr:hypothetical protein [Silicimonas sp.]
MTAPDTNIKKQSRRHKGPLAGIPLAILLAVVAFVGFLIWAALSDADTDGPQEAQTGVSTA